MVVNEIVYLRYFYYDGATEPVLDYKVIGTGAPYGSIFLKQNWAPTSGSVDKNITNEIETSFNTNFLEIAYVRRNAMDI
jgi:hypothetical protein